MGSLILYLFAFILLGIVSLGFFIVRIVMEAYYRARIAAVNRRNDRIRAEINELRAIYYSQSR